MISHGSSIQIFSGNAHTQLARDIAKCLDIPLALCSVSTFSDGEITINIKETVRGSDVFIVQPTCTPVNNHLMELMIMIDAVKRASAGRITAVIPYMGYARQDRKVYPRDPITAKLVADLITTAGANRVLTMDLHAAQIQGFFNIPVDHLLGIPLLAGHYLERQFAGEDLVVVSPDLGSVTRARNCAAKLDASLAIIDKRRPKANVAEVMNIIGDISGKRCLLVDDMIDTAGTIVSGAKALLDRGAREVYACCTHGVFSGDAISRLEDSVIKELVTTDTIPLSDEAAHRARIRRISVASMFAEAIERIYEDKPISDLYV